MLRDLVSSVGMDSGAFAELLGVSPGQLQEWFDGRRDVPATSRKSIETLIGLTPDALVTRNVAREEIARLVPPLWKKLRSASLSSDAALGVAAVRLLAARYDEALRLTARPPSDRVKDWIDSIKRDVDPQDPAARQGECAAAAFMELSALGHCARGIGEVFRAYLRSVGLVVFESPVKAAGFEGFCIPVGPTGRSRPCLFANSYKTTWFRRNYVLLHELAHAVFDLDAAAAMFDIERGNPEVEQEVLAEERADVFALHVLVPKRLLVAMANRGLSLEGATARTLACITAEVHAEPRHIIRAARHYGMISGPEAERLRSLETDSELKRVSIHARGLAALRPEQLANPEISRWGSRFTTFPIAGLRLPIPLVRAVAEALDGGRISESKAAELLMLAPEELNRFRAMTRTPN